MIKLQILTVVRKLAFEDLDECMYKILEDTLAYLEGDSEGCRHCNQRCLFIL